jgi:hypothetical protein
MEGDVIRTRVDSLVKKVTCLFCWTREKVAALDSTVDTRLDLQEKSGQNQIGTAHGLAGNVGRTECGYASFLTRTHSAFYQLCVCHLLLAHLLPGRPGGGDISCQCQSAGEGELFYTATRLVQALCPATIVHAHMPELQEAGGNREGMGMFCRLQRAWQSGCSCASSCWWCCSPPFHDDCLIERER